MASEELEDLKEALDFLGPRKVEGKEFSAEAHDPVKIQKLIERRGSSHPTFGTMTKTIVVSKRASEDICSSGSGSCSCAGDV